MLTGRRNLPDPDEKAAPCRDSVFRDSTSQLRIVQQIWHVIEHVVTGQAGNIDDDRQQADGGKQPAG